MTTVATHALKATIASRVSNYQRSLTFLIVNDIAPFVPDQKIDRRTIKIPPNLHLADPEFHRPAPIDLLLGSGTALSILCVGQIVLSRSDESDLYLQKSQLGWVIGGSAPVSSPANSTLCHATTALQFDLTRFWEVEEGPQRQHLSESDVVCESHFQEHTVRNRDGRYVVALPFNEKLSGLGDTTILDNCSSWGKLQRIIARCLRWKKSNTTKGSITSSEIRYAHDAIIKMIQRQHFAEELRCLSRSEIGIRGKLQQLNPFIDKDRILRVGGRLKNSRIPFTQKHPIVLPKARITAVIIEHEHQIQLHAGTQATLYAIRRRYWPIHGRSQVGKTIRNCVRCCRVQPPPTQYVMGDLPEARVTDSRPFANVGVDYCGPFFIKERRHRSRTHIKVYVAVFVCLSVKAIHLELVSDLTSEAFIAALRRFIARRGHCINIYSDNGTNFVGANNELRDLRELLQSDDHNEKVKTFLADRSITWNFIPPLTPHFGGIWEAAVKSFKRHFWRIAGAERFTFEVFNTLIIEIEAVLNSRPLTPISSDPNDTLVLTPGHFLIGDSLTNLRERDFRDVPTNRLSTWQHIQKPKQHFWNRWYKEYLNEMTSRSRWTSGTHPIKEGTIVLLREDNTPPMQWPLGRVIKVHPGSDGIVRAATVRTATTTLDRGIKRLVPLPNQPDEEPRDPTSTSRTRDPPTYNN